MQPFQQYHAQSAIKSLQSTIIDLQRQTPSREAQSALSNALALLQHTINELSAASTSCRQGSACHTCHCAAGARLHHLIQNSSTVLYSIDPVDFRVIYISPNIHDQYGHTRQAFVEDADYLFNHIHPDDRVQVRTALTTALTQDTSTVEYRFRHANGTYHWHQGHVTVIRDSAGHIAEIACCATDITEQKHSEIIAEETRRSHNHHVLVQPSHGIIVVDQQGIVRFTNPMAQAIFHRHTSLLDSQLGIPLAVQGATEIDIVSPEGDIGVAEMHVAPITWEEESAHLVIFYDITERKRAEEELRRSEQRYRAIVEDQTEFICRFLPNGTLIFVNDSYARRQRVTPEDMIGRDFFAFVTPPVCVDTHTSAHMVNAETPLLVQEYRIVMPDGTSTWEHWTQRAILDDSGHVVEIQAVGRDITELKLTDQALREERELLAQHAQHVGERTAELSLANIELAQAMRAKDEFLAMMSHELRTPLNTILVLTEILGEEVYGPLTEQQGQKLQTITTSGRHLLSIINDILDIAKIGAGQITLDVQPWSVETLCEASMKLVRTTAQQKHIRTNLSLDGNVDTIDVDGLRIKQVLVNLLDNAVKFTPDGGSIGLEVTSDPHQQVVHFTVWDTGIGIDPDQMGQLFKPFAQLDRRLARKYNGTGLGLALVYRLVELHGGHVSLTSELAQGSRFTVSLPWKGEGELRQLAPPTYMPRNRSSAIISMTTQPTILLAEDHKDTADVMAGYLGDLGYQVIVAYDGNEAINRVREIQPDLILMDIQMPWLDGLSAIRLIREDATLADIPIVAVTALVMPGDRERCMEAGANEYLSKPIQVERLKQIIECFVGVGCVANDAA